MKLHRSFLPVVCHLCALVLAFVRAGWAEESKEEIPEPFRSFIPEAQKHVAEFLELPVGTTEGRHTLFTVRVDEKPIVIGEHRFGCVRFVAPKEGPRDMVWAFSVPEEWGQWYILPATGTMTGFRNWINADHLYAELPATVDNAARLQVLTAGSFKPGETYILWFKQQSALAGPVTLTGAINFLTSGEKKKWDAEAIEKGLGLKNAPMPEQVAYFKSRGGRALLDRRLFEPGYGPGRIEDLLYTLRHNVRTSDGFYIGTQIIIPPCKKEPPLAAVRAAYGDADFILSAEERRLFSDNVPKDEAAYYYDYFVFLVEGKPDQLRITCVSSQAEDTSKVRPRQDGLTWGDVPMPDVELRIFYRDRKEIARVAFWGKPKAHLVSGELPTDTFQRSGEGGDPSEELKHLGNGNWEYRSVYSNGQTARTGALQGHAYHGAWRDFFPDGKPQSEANFLKGLLDGTLKQWRETGESRELHYQAGKLLPEGPAEPR